MSIIKRHVIALLYRYELAIVVEAIVGGDNYMMAPRPRCYASNDGDHAGALEMEIKSTRRQRPYHVTYCLHVMFVFLCILFCLDRDGSIIR